jgi:hypothetical protein
MCWADSEQLLGDAPVARVPSSHGNKLSRARQPSSQIVLRLFCSSLYKIWFVSLLGFVFAQNQASHPLTITLPRLLSVQLNDTQLNDTQRIQLLPLTGGNLQEILPSRQRLGIRSNAIWLLSASFTPCHPNDAARLSLRPDQTKEGQLLRNYPRVVLTGAATNGWRFIPLDSYLEPSVSPCQGKLIYTLTQP